jgi:multiple sugar transport system permease protein
MGKRAGNLAVSNTSVKPRWRTRETLMAWLFILPSLLGITVFVILPTLRGFALSFTNSDLLTRADFIGLANYQKLISDKQFWSSLGITLKYVLFNIPIQTALALGLAVLMVRLTKSTLVRGIVFMPYLVPMLMAMLVGLSLLNYEFGPINGVLQLLGLDKIPFLNSLPDTFWFEIK